MTVKKNDISFEEALKDLEKIVEDLNNGDMELEKAITAYEKGIQLKNICEERLKNAQERIELIQNKKQENLVIRARGRKWLSNNFNSSFFKKK